VAVTLTYVENRSARVRSWLGTVAIGTIVGATTVLVMPAGPAFADSQTGSAFFAGYEVLNGTPQSQPPQTASERFVVPSVTCSKKSDVGFGVLVNGRTGSTSGSASVRATCERARGPAVYTAVIGINHVDTTLSTTVSPGDAVSVSAADVATGSSATLTDVSTGFSQTLTGAGSISEYAVVGELSAEVSILTNHVPSFPAETITNAQIGGADVGTYSAATGREQALKYRYGPGRRATLQIQPGALSEPSTFSLTWVSG
jgi:hypothetical protein